MSELDAYVWMQLRWGLAAAMVRGLMEVSPPLLRLQNQRPSVSHVVLANQCPSVS